jgi:P pilus assembly chaperone PapD
MLQIISAKALQAVRLPELPLCPGRLRKSVLLAALLFALAQGQAWAGLMLYPTRVVFEGNQRTAQVELINNGTEAETYRISLVNRRMSEDGEFIAVEQPEPGEQFADSLLRYSPRQVTLQPGAGQVVRIMVRKPAGLAPGEYRSHLLFAKQPDPKGRTSIESGSVGTEEGLGVQLQALVGASIPIIVRHGKTEAGVKLSGLELQAATANRPAMLTLQLERSGNQSVYGDVTVSFTPRGGVEQVVASAGGVAVYTPNSLRRAKLALQPPAGMVLAHGALRVTYRERAEDGGRLLAEAVLQLP